MPVWIKGKEYFQVGERVKMVHDDSIEDNWEKLDVLTEIVVFEETHVLMKATIVTPKGTYMGHAYERADSSQINETSHVENCETSCIGRALASAGYLGHEFASANEVENAILQQTSQNFPETASANGGYAKGKASTKQRSYASDLVNQKVETNSMSIEQAEGLLETIAGSDWSGLAAKEMIGKLLDKKTVW